MGRAVRADASLRRLGAQVWVGGSPLRLFRLTGAGDELVAAVVDSGADGLGVNGQAAQRLLDRLVLAGAAHPLAVPDARTPARRNVTLVVPVRDRTAALERLLEAVVADPDAAPGAVVVVDDGSRDAAAVAAVCEAAGARLLRFERPRGPGGARNAGLDATVTPLVAFVDSDVVPGSGWMEPLLSHLADDRVAMVAPRVRSAAGESLLSRYERSHSPLDLGPRASPVRPRATVSYVPAATLLARADVVRGAGGFDETLRHGEDVDLVWRLVEAGHAVRYEPDAEVHHDPRPGWHGWVAQRFAYGASAAELDRRHPGAAAPVVCSPWSAASWLLFALGHPFAAAAVAGGSALALARRLEGVPARESLVLAASGHLAAGRQMARASVRPWWPVLVVAALSSRRGRRVATAALGAALAVAPGGASEKLLSLADDAAYGAGVWWGVARSRRFGALAPALPGWP